MVLEHCATKEALVLPGHVGAPFGGYIDGSAGLSTPLWLSGAR
jgi:hypothetical protein